nr:MAG TPA: hypothetical protein [Caudoviricetes sp.]
MLLPVANLSLAHDYKCLTKLSKIFQSEIVNCPLPGIFCHFQQMEKPPPAIASRGEYPILYSFPYFRR